MNINFSSNYVVILPVYYIVYNIAYKTVNQEDRYTVQHCYWWRILDLRPLNVTMDQSESSIPEGCVKAFLKFLITMFAVFTVPRDEQYHGYTYQRLSSEGCVLPDPKCWAAHRIHYNFAYYPVCWWYQSGVERKKRMEVRNKEQLFSVPETKNLRLTLLFFSLYVRLVLYLLLEKT